MHLNLVDPGFLILFSPCSLCFCCPTFFHMCSGDWRMPWARRSIDSRMNVRSHGYLQSNTLQRVSTNIAGTRNFSCSLWWNCSAWWKRHNWLWDMYNLGCLCLLKDSAISKLHITLDLSRFVMSCHPLLFSFLIFLLLSLCLHCFCILIRQRARLKRAYWSCKAHRSRVDLLLGRLDSSSKTNFILPWKKVKMFVKRHVRSLVCFDPPYWSCEDQSSASI